MDKIKKYVDLSKLKTIGITRLGIFQEDVSEYKVYIQYTGQSKEIFGAATTFEKMNERIMKVVADMVAGGYIVEKVWEDEWDGNLRPEVLDLLREQFPIGCQVEVVTSNVPHCVGKKGTLIEIDDQGRFAIGQSHVTYTFDQNTFRRIDKK